MPKDDCTLYGLKFQSQRLVLSVCSCYLLVGDKFRVVGHSCRSLRDELMAGMHLIPDNRVNLKKEMTASCPAATEVIFTHPVSLA